jgi:hypothetical protein
MLQNDISQETIRQETQQDRAPEGQTQEKTHQAGFTGNRWGEEILLLSEAD